MTALAFFTAMQKEMDQQAADVWEMIEYSRSSGYRLRLGEVTITELNFFKLRNFWTQQVYIDTNEPDETKTGADWEWIIGHGSSWVQIRVQAKIIDRKGSFTQLGHGPKGAPRQQMDSLIEPLSDDVACRWMPLYVFYTATPPAALPVPMIASFDQRTGCSARLARDVRKTYGPGPNGRATLTAKAHLPDSVPWSQIFSGLIDRLKAESLSDIIDSLANLSFPKGAKKIDDFWKARPTDGKCEKKLLPRYLRAILDPPEGEDDGFNDAPLATLKVEKPAPEPSLHADEQNNRVLQEKQVPEVNAPSQAIAIEESAVDDAPYPPLPSRKLLLSRSQSEGESISLPSMVSVIDIGRLPTLPEAFSQ